MIRENKLLSNIMVFYCSVSYNPKWQLVLVLTYLFLFYTTYHPANLQSRVKKGKMTQEKFDKTISLLKGVLDYESFKDVDMIIEVILKSYLFVLPLALCKISILTVLGF